MRPRGWTTSSSDLRVQLTAERRYVYPDASVVCGEPEFLDDDGMTLLNPTLVVEVLSRTTADFDAGSKAKWYRKIPSLQVLMLVSQDTAAVTVHRRAEGHWITEDLSGLDATLDVLGARLAFADLYDGITLDAR